VLKIKDPLVLPVIGFVLIGLTVIDFQDEKYKGLTEEEQEELPVEEQEELENQNSLNKMVHWGFALASIIMFVLALYYVMRDDKASIQEDKEKKMEYWKFLI